MTISRARGRVMGAAVALAGVVALAPVVASADTTAGAGAATALITYSPAVPPLGIGVLGQPCASVSWATGTAAAAGGAVNTASNAYAGLVALGMSGSGCESFLGASGTVAVSLTGVEPLGVISSSLQCSFSATYLRLFTLLEIDGPGSCTIDGWATGTVYISARLVLTPTDPGLGVIGSLQDAAVTGSWQIDPGHS